MVREVLAKLETGESVENLSREYDASPESIVGWQIKAASNPGHYDSTTPSAPDTDDSGSLERVRNVLGGLGSKAPPESSHGHVGNNGSTPPPPTPEKADPLPTITAESLPHIIAGIDKMILTGIAATKNTGLPREVVEQILPMSAGDLKTLEFFAPYAVEYAPMILQYAKPVMACMFVGFWGLSIATRTKALERACRQYEEWETRRGASPVPNNPIPTSEDDDGNA